MGQRNPLPDLRSLLADPDQPSDSKGRIDLVAGGTALLAVCGGYQNLGIRFRTSLGVELACPGMLPVSTDATGVRRRLVGPVVARLNADLLASSRHPANGPPPDPLDPGAAWRVVGFENRRAARDDRRIPGWAHRVVDPIKALIGY